MIPLEVQLSAESHCAHCRIDITVTCVELRVPKLELAESQEVYALRVDAHCRKSHFLAEFLRNGVTDFGILKT